LEKQRVIAEINDVIEKSDQLSDAIKEVKDAKWELAKALATLAQDQPTVLGKEAEFLVTSMFPSAELQGNLNNTKEIRRLMDQLLGFV
jgi:uncharacterized coiled-coil DUF342 family protein